MKNGAATGNDHINIDALKAGEDTISKTIAKLYTKCLSERRRPTAAPLRDRSVYSTTDHIHVVNELKEKCRSYNIPLCIAFVAYEKAFDSVQTQAVLTSIQEQGIDDVHIELLKEIYTNSSTTVHLHNESNTINIRRGVQQGDTISFTAALESIFQRLTWETGGLKIDGEYLSHLRFTDDILICANTPHELQ